ncbi:hypothetical protein DPMN_104569 [Dreissena polymorpha]|uniref:Uncharacterized protein n=1 Tax=Dreissena polymorpha TaxID=45954 RepID=A0A9D4K190_DREPO|nr:hypothetical protein DPMN_104569 [Dreissena polymorpha]
MTESVMKPVRDLYRLSVNHCNTSLSNISECFIGSRKLPMLQAKAFDVSQTVVNSRCFQAGKSTSSKMAADLIQRCLPTMTSVITQSPPPAHHGG